MMKMFRKLGKSEGGFNFIELVVVITIIAILIGMAVPRIRGIVDRATVAKLGNDLKVVENLLALDMVKENPTTDLTGEGETKKAYTKRAEEKEEKMFAIDESIIKDAGTELKADGFFANKEGDVFFDIEKDVKMKQAIERLAKEDVAVKED